MPAVASTIVTLVFKTTKMANSQQDGEQQSTAPTSSSPSSNSMWTKPQAVSTPTTSTTLVARPSIFGGAKPPASIFGGQNLFMSSSSNSLLARPSPFPSVSASAPVYRSPATANVFGQSFTSPSTSSKQTNLFNVFAGGQMPNTAPNVISPENIASEVKSVMSSAPVMTGKTSPPKSTASSRSHRGSEERFRGRRSTESRHARRTVLSRPTISGGLFGQALADIQKSKSRDPRLAKEFQRLPKSEIFGDSKHRGTQEVVTASSNEISQIKSIVCRGVPGEMNTDEILRHHFSQFGKVVRFYRSPQRESANIHFESHAEAADAKENGSVIDPRYEPMAIFWSLSSAAARRKSTSPRDKPKSREVQFISLRAKKSSATSTNRDVDEELRSMTSNLSDLENQSYLPRPLTQSPVKETKSIGSTSVKRDKIPVFSPSTSAQSQEQLDLLRMQTKTAKDRFLLLDARDKLLRQTRKKQSNITTARAAVGMCMDMCPEKERCLREDAMQLHYFENASVQADVESEIEHALTVKEYSRSSADQEEPLPHELRPAEVLSLTMDYLVCNVMDKLERAENPAEWFDFVWNRTRAIRKDITQQHLCDLTSVSLVEKCARFHIFCAERLSEADIVAFDPKINNENLTKCLQTLKHFYHDLGVKGVRCDSEAEFRAYDILLNLNLGDILRQVQQLSSEVQNSPEVRFALKSFMAVNSNNYVRFFKLVDGATFLNACILHRYFIQVRSKAIGTLTRAYCPPAHSAMFPIQELVQLLGFENEVEAAEFCALHGMSVDRGGEHVVFDRGIFYHPDVLPAIRRAPTLIERKKTGTIGEVVHGGPLPENPLFTYRPHSSFDAQGFFMTTDVIGSSGTELPEDTPVESTRLGAIEPELNMNEVAKDIARILLVEVTEEIMDDLAQEYADHVTICDKLAMEISKAYIEAAVDGSLRVAVKEVFSDEADKQRRLEEIRLNREKEDRDMRAAALVSISDGLIMDFVNEELFAVTEEVFKDEESALRKQRIERLSHIVLNWIVEDVITQNVVELSESVYDTDVVKRFDQLKLIADRIRLSAVRPWVKKWRLVIAKRKRQQRSMRDFPAIPGALAKKMADVALKPMAELVSPVVMLCRQRRFGLNLSASLFSREISDRLNSMSIDLANLIDEKLRLKRNWQSRFWKLVVSFPRADEGSVEKDACNWVEMKLGCKKVENDKQVFVVSSQSTTEKKKETMILDRRLPLSVCVKGARGILEQNVEEKMKIEFQGTDAVLFMMSASCKMIREQDFWNEARSRLRQILRLRTINEVPYPVPLAVIVIEGMGLTMDERKLVNELHLEDLKMKRIISSYSICGLDIKNAKAFSQFFDVLSSLATDSVSLPLLSRKPLFDFCEDGVAKWFIGPAHEDRGQRRKSGLIPQSPQVLISLFNSVIEYIANISNSRTLHNIPWPAPEFVGQVGNALSHGLPSLDWNSPDHLADVADRILAIKLPEFERIDADDWTDVRATIDAYVQKICNPAGSSSYALVSKIESLLSKTLETFRSECCVRFRVADCLPSFDDIPWTDLIDSIVEHRLTAVNNFDRSGKNALFVYYLDEEFQRAFPFPAKWRNATTQFQQRNSTLRLESLERSVLKRTKDNEEDSLTNESSFSFSISRKRVCSNPSTLASGNVQAEIFLSRIKAEREESDLLQRKLTAALNESNPMPLTSTPIVRVGRSNLRMTEEKIAEKLEIPLGFTEKLDEFRRNVHNEKQKDVVFNLRLKMMMDE